MHAKHKGPRNELLAVCWLMSLGYEVFRNVSPFGAADLIAIREDETILLDVKTYNSTTVQKATDEQKRLGVKLLLVSPEGTCQITDFKEPLLPGRLCVQCGNPIIGKRQTLYCSRKCKTRAGNLRRDAKTVLKLV